MIISFNPRIAGGFVEKVLRSEHVKEQIDILGLSAEEKHNLCKAILITGFNSFDIDINDVINKINDKKD